MVNFDGSTPSSTSLEGVWVSEGTPITFFLFYLTASSLLKIQVNFELNMTIPNYEINKQNICAKLIKLQPILITIRIRDQLTFFDFSVKQYSCGVHSLYSSFSQPPWSRLFSYHQCFYHFYLGYWTRLDSCQPWMWLLMLHCVVVRHYLFKYMFKATQFTKILKLI